MPADGDVCRVFDRPAKRGQGKYHEKIDNYFNSFGGKHHGFGCMPACRKHAAGQAGNTHTDGYHRGDRQPDGVANGLAGRITSKTGDIA